MAEYKELKRALVNTKTRQAISFDTIMRIALSTVVVHGEDAQLYCPQVFLTLLLEEKQVSSIAQLDNISRRLQSVFRPREISFVFDEEMIIAIIDELVGAYGEILRCLIEESLAISKLMIENPLGPIVGNLSELTELSFDHRQFAIKRGKETEKKLDATLLFFRLARDDAALVEVSNFWLGEEASIRYDDESLIFDITPYLSL